MRAWRNTVIRFGLFAVPVSLAPLVGKSDVQGHTYDAETGERVKRAWTLQDGSTLAGETVTRYDVLDAEPVEVPEDAIRLDGEVGVTLEASVPLGEVDASLYDAAYVLLPDKAAPKGLATLAAVLRDGGIVLAGTARFTSSLSARSVVIRWSPLVGGIVLHTLHAVERVRLAEAKQALAGMVEPGKAEVAQGEAFVASLPDSFSALVTDERDARVRAYLASVASPVQALTEPAGDILQGIRDGMESPVMPTTAVRRGKVAKGGKVAKAPSRKRTTRARK